MDYQVQVGNPGPFLFLNAFERFVYVKTLTLASSRALVLFPNHFFIFTKKFRKTF